MCAPESAADGPTAAAGKGPGATFTMKQVAQHCTPEDCWMVIDHQVYDVTSWVPKHPGGEIIAVKAGGDCTQLFKAYHPLYVQKMLGKFQIGSLKDSPEDLTTHTEFAAQSVFTATDGQEPAKAAVVADDEFYTTVKRRVESFFKETGLRRRDCPAMYIKSAIILAGVAGFYYLSFFHFTTFWVALLSSVVYGIFAGEVGVSIMHDANHGAYSRNSLLQQCMAFTLDIVGASSFMWRQQHVVGHHCFTNVNDRDPDIRCNDPDVRVTAPSQRVHDYHKYQHLYLPFMYGLLGPKSILLDDFANFADKRIGFVRVAAMTPKEGLLFWGGKAFSLFMLLVLPNLYGNFGVVANFALFWAGALTTGYMLAFMFQVAHVVGDVYWPEVDASNGKVAVGWAAGQVATSANFAPGHWGWTHFSGGLNHQIEHHLFPGVCHVHYPRIAPIVQRTCEEFGVPYVAYPTFMAAVAAHFRHMKNVGHAMPLVPKLGDA